MMFIMTASVTACGDIDSALMEFGKRSSERRDTQGTVDPDSEKNAGKGD